MDVQQLLWTTFSQFWWVAPLLFVTALFKLPAVKGWFGEQLGTVRFFVFRLLVKFIAPIRCRT